jgi:ABC-type transport system involved in multi-copper enzyme maturation permease subunit
MNWRLIRAIAIKDLKEVRQNRMAWMPAIIVPLIFVIVLPLIFLALPRAFGSTSGEIIGDVDMLMGMVSPELAAQFEGLNLEQTAIVLMLGYMLAPMFLILPLMFSSIVGAESFVGEKERKTLEALLYSPASDRELFLAKMIAAVVPALMLTVLCFAAYTLVLNVVGWPTMGRIWFPLPHWWPLILWVSPAVSTLGMAATVIVSTRVSTFMEAYQFSGALVLPLVILMIGQIAGLISLSVALMLGVGLLIWVLDAVLIRVGLRIFRRSQLMSRI